MAHQASIALGGYFAAPEPIVDAVAPLIRVHRRDARSYSLLDPCAADGAAVYSLRRQLFGDTANEASVYAIEMEAKRFASLEKLSDQRNYGKPYALHGNAFAAEWSMVEASSSYHNTRRNHTGANILWLNPPYENGAKELQFLERFTPCLMPGGLLINLIPFYSLHKSADTLGREYHDLHCYRFPEPLFSIDKTKGFRQVVLMGTRRLTPLLAPDATVVAQLRTWSNDSDTIPVLPAMGSSRPLYTVPASGDATGFAEWRMKPVDTNALMQRYVPWSETDRAGTMHSIAGVTPDLTASEGGGNMMRRVFPVACKMAAAHTSTAIAAGAMSGRLMSPDDDTLGLPRIIVKGTFRRDLKTIETKTNKKGDVTALVKIQQPTLQVVGLDVDKRTYVHFRNEAEESSATDLASMTVGDVIACYGQDLVRVMRENCPLLYDKDDVSQHWQIPSVGSDGYRLYVAQQHAVRGLVELLGGMGAKKKDRRGKAAWLLGAIGSGKSITTCATAKCIGAETVLVMCPPHLGPGWSEQIALALPNESRTVYLHDVIDVDRLAAEVKAPWQGPGDRPMTFAVLTTSTAKLSHAYAGVSTGYCPDCGEPTPVSTKLGINSADELARTRAHCMAQRIIPGGPLSRAAHTMALLMVGVSPYAPEIAQCLSGRHENNMVALAQKRVGEAGMKGGKPVANQETWDRIRSNATMRMAVNTAVASLLHKDVAEAWDKHAHSRKSSKRAMIVGLLWAINDHALTAKVCEKVYRHGIRKDSDTDNYDDAETRAYARELYLLPTNGVEQNNLLATLKAIEFKVAYYHTSKSTSELWREWEYQRGLVSKTSSPVEDTYDTKLNLGNASLEARDGTVATWRSHQRGSASAAIDALGMLASLGTWPTSAYCGCALYQAIPRPKKVALASYIGKYYPKLFDLFILDEAHEGRGGDAVAQSVAMRRLIRLGLPTICATGSVMGGLASDLFAMQWAIDPAFRAEFPNGFSAAEHIQGSVIRPRRVSDAPEFGRRYGYLKLLVDVSGDGKDSKNPVGYGAQSDRIDENTRAIGYAPGVLPLFVLRYLLRRAVTIHKADLDKELPACLEIVEGVKPNKDQVENYKHLSESLLNQIKKDKRTSLAGKLMGAMAEIPSYYDLAANDVGNVKEVTNRGEYRINYPDNAECGIYAGMNIANATGLDPSKLLPKEEWLIAKCKAELAEGRPCMVFATHRMLLPRLQRILQQALGEPVAYLDAGKVDSGDRIAWINHNILGKPETVTKRGVDVTVPGKTARVMVVNSVAVQTGINNLVYFPTIIWMENPHCMAIAYRQAVGRSHRIGQTKEVRVYFAVYRGTIQEAAHELLMHKVAVSLGTDGLDASSALEAAGVGGGDGVDGFSVAKLLHDLATGERVGITRKKRPMGGVTITRTPVDVAHEATAPANDVKATKAPSAVQVGLAFADAPTVANVTQDVVTVPANGNAGPSGGMTTVAASNDGAVTVTADSVLAAIVALWSKDSRGPLAVDVAALLGCEVKALKLSNDTLKASGKVTVTGATRGTRYQPTGT